MNLKLLKASARVVSRNFGKIRPCCAVILGSGWSAAVEQFDTLRQISYASIPCIGASTVKGHPGKLSLVKAFGKHVLLFLGRRHSYEGVPWESIAFPVFMAKQAGCRIIILTNASGGIRKDLAPGDIVALDDHINMTGCSPLIGPHDPAWGVRFPDQSAVYDRTLSGIVCGSPTLKVKRGVYAWMTGPAYETPAEIRALARMGADAVGMSTVPEAMLANAVGLKVVALSCIANRAAGLGNGRLSHADVLNAMDAAKPRMHAIVKTLLRRITSMDV